MQRSAEAQKHIEEAKKLIEELRGLKVSCYDGDWLRTWDKSIDEVHATMIIAQIYMHLMKANVDCRIFNGSLAVSEFRDNSTRTRFSFAKAASFLGLSLQDLDSSTSQVAHGETVRETATMISFLTEAIGIRDDKYIHEGHRYQKEVADALAESKKDGVLDRRPCVINLQCDEDHPTQSMSDLLHIANHYGGIDKLRGKKIAMTWAYSPSYGKPLSVAQSLINLLPRFGAEVHLAYPEGYDLLPEVVEQAKKGAEIGGGKLIIGHDMKEAVKDCEVVYCKSWCPYHILEKKRDLIRAGKGKSPEMDALERDGLAENAKHMDWTVTNELMKTTKPSMNLNEALYMHCLPADITGLSCEHGEVDNDVFERQRVNTYNEAKWKPFVIASMITMCRVPDAAEAMDKDRKSVV